MIQPNDAELFADELFIQYTGRSSHAPSVIRVATPVTNGQAPTKALPLAPTREHLPTTERPQPKEQDAETETSGARLDDSARKSPEPADGDKAKQAHADQVRPTSLPPEMDRKGDEPRTNGTGHDDGTNKQNGESHKPGSGRTSQPPAPAAPTNDSDVEMAEAPEPDHPSSGAPASYQPTNPSRAASISTSAAADDLYIHPLFLAPRSARPDRDQGLPEQEAEDVRRLLQLYVQKQEEVCRGTKKLYEGLLRADRYRKTVLAWSKAEAHRGEMSDGEDWYDREEWGLSEDLKKGHDEEEEETAQTQKKTRNRK